MIVGLKLRPEETRLIGALIFQNGRLYEDVIRNRITWLTDKCLRKVATDAGGWEKLYLDPEDNRYWELTYPEGNFHETGSIQLSVVSAEYAERKYHLERS